MTFLLLDVGTPVQTMYCSCHFWVCAYLSDLCSFTTMRTNILGKAIVTNELPKKNTAESWVPGPFRHLFLFVWTSEELHSGSLRIKLSARQTFPFSRLFWILRLTEDAMCRLTSKQTGLEVETHCHAVCKDSANFSEFVLHCPCKRTIQFPDWWDQKLQHYFSLILSDLDTWNRKDKLRWNRSCSSAHKIPMQLCLAER